MAVCSASMSGLGAAGDDERAAAGAFERYGAVDGAGEDARVGCAAWVGFIGAASG